MGCRRTALTWLSVLGAVAVGGPALAQGTRGEPAPLPPLATPGSVFGTSASMPYEQLPAWVRDRVRAVMEQPTLATRGPSEAFHCRPNVYYWLLDHPDQAVRLWRCLGAKCTDIEAQGDNRFGWQDPQGGEVHWHTVLRTARQRIWYAEGRVRPGLLLPSVPVQAVVVLNHAEGCDGQGRPAVRHQMDLVLHANSHAVALAARLFGASAPRLAEQYVGQMETFFGALAWYLSEHPDKATTLFEEIQRPQRGGVVPAGAITPSPPSVPHQ
jgi:hypothetical protein